MINNFIRFRFWLNQLFFRTIPLVLTSVFLIVLSLGCNPVYPDFLNPPQITETEKKIQPTSTGVKTTSSPLPIQVEQVVTPTPTQKPETRLYQHPDYIFELSFPESWSVLLEPNETRVSDPATGVSIVIQYIDTIDELDQESLTRLVDARETNVFGEFDGYLEVDRQVSESDPSYIVKKRLVEEEDSKIVVSQYRQIGQFVLVLDLWSDQEYYEGNEAELSSIVASLSTGEGMEESIESQGELLTTFNNGSFSLDVPQYWHYQSTSGDNSIVDTFISPDERAIIQMATYDDGELITGSVAGAFVRNLLRNYYAKDITVTSYRYLPDGREELIWRSDGSNYEGITYFDVSDTELYIYTVMTETDYKELYLDLLTNVLISFQSLPSG